MKRAQIARVSIDGMRRGARCARQCGDECLDIALQSLAPSWVRDYAISDVSGEKAGASAPSPLSAMHCYGCAREIVVVERVGLRDECPGCGAKVHVCLNCDFYEPGLNNDCRETSADRVVDKDRSNFCDYFRPSGMMRAAPASPAREKLDAIFRKR
jgi:hypothetical protein